MSKVIRFSVMKLVRKFLAGWVPEGHTLTVEVASSAVSEEIEYTCCMSTGTAGNPPVSRESSKIVILDNYYLGN